MREDMMRIRMIARAAVIAGSLGFLIGPVFSAPPPLPMTPELTEAARKEGKIVYYTSIDMKVAQQLAKAFERKYPGITVQVERTGSERLYQRVSQERANIFTADVYDLSDQALFVAWKKQGILEPFIPEEVLKWPVSERDPDGAYFSVRFTLMPIAYNTNLVKPEEAPKSFADLLDPKWIGKIVKGHPGYSGSIMTSTFQLVAGTISINSESRRFCRCNLRPSRRRSWHWVNARCQPTVSNMCTSNLWRAARRSRSSIRIHSQLHRHRRECTASERRATVHQLHGVA
jgi:Bacterial extracellular solute-binding protein